MGVLIGESTDCPIPVIIPDFDTGLVDLVNSIYLPSFGHPVLFFFILLFSHFHPTYPNYIFPFSLPYTKPA